MDFYVILPVFTQFCLIGSIPVDPNHDDIHSEYLYGRSQEEYRYVINNLNKLRELSWSKHGITPKHKFVEDDLKGLMDDIILTREDIDEWLNGSPDDRIFKRIKRNIVNFVEYPEKKWTLPILYSVDTTTITDEAHHGIIRRALNTWEDNTCVTFEELDSVEGFDQPYMYIHGDSDGCSSYVGRQDVFPQYVNMNPDCFGLVGIAIHEIGHALGLYHEQTRPDRDEYVDVIWDNIQEDKLHNFDIKTSSDVTLSENPYGYNSVMHYGALFFSVDNAANKYTIVPKNPNLVTVMGQGTQLSFYDAKVVNTAYCSDLCSNQLLCQNGGYQDPKNCSQCRCPDEWMGTLCGDNNRGSTGCNPFIGYREHNSDDTDITFYLYSPTSDEFGHFIPGESCFWTLEVPENMFIKIWFGERFGLYVSSGICLFWVEIRNPSETQGQRYCGYYNDQPPFVHYSQTNKSLVLFQSFSGVTPTPFIDRSFRTLGFKLYYRFSTCGNETCEETRCSCEELLDDNQQTHEELCVTRSWCRNNGYPDPDNCGQCICPDGWTGTYCTEITDNPCTNIIQCYYGGQPDPSDCSRCLCPEERTGNTCLNVATGSGDCSLASGSYMTSTYTFSEGSFTPGKKCFWQITSPENSYMEFSLVNTLGLYRSTEGVCVFWLEIFDPTLDVDTNGRRFCGFQGSTAPVSHRTENNVAFLVFKSFAEDFPTNSTSNFGFSLKMEAVKKSSTTSTILPTSTIITSTPTSSASTTITDTSSSVTTPEDIESTVTSSSATTPEEIESTVTSSSVTTPEDIEATVTISSATTSEEIKSTVTISSATTPEEMKSTVTSSSATTPEDIESTVTSTSATTSEEIESTVISSSATTPEDIESTVTSSSATTPEEIESTVTSSSVTTPEDIESTVTSSSATTPEDIETTVTISSATTSEEIKSTVTISSATTPEEIESTVTSSSAITPEESETTVTSSSATTSEEIESTMTSSSATTPEETESTVPSSSVTTPEEIESTVTSSSATTPEDIESTVTSSSATTQEEIESAETSSSATTPKEIESTVTSSSSILPEYCLASPCEHGTCQVIGAGYQCLCEVHYTGKLCDFDLRSGVWSQWSAYTTCSKTCDYGLQSRQRTCLLEDTCEGDDTEVRVCNSVACPAIPEQSDHGTVAKVTGPTMEEFLQKEDEFLELVSEGVNDYCTNNNVKCCQILSATPTNSGLSEIFNIFGLHNIYLANGFPKETEETEIMVKIIGRVLRTELASRCDSRSKRESTQIYVSRDIMIEAIRQQKDTIDEVLGFHVTVRDSGTDDTGLNPAQKIFVATGVSTAALILIFSVVAVLICLLKNRKHNDPVKRPFDVDYNIGTPSYDNSGFSFTGPIIRGNDYWTRGRNLPLYSHTSTGPSRIDQNRHQRRHGNGSPLKVWYEIKFSPKSVPHHLRSYGNDYSEVLRDGQNVSQNNLSLGLRRDVVGRVSGQQSILTTSSTSATIIKKLETWSVQKDMLCRC